MALSIPARTRALTLFAGASAAALAAATPAAALQDSAGEAASDDVVVVSARRREETLQDVPLAVTAATGEALDRIGATDITDVQRITPNATIEVARGSNTTLIAFIRGVGQQDPLWGFEPGVGIYVDDVFIARPQGAVLDLYDLERIEVLRGPQGTLYGRNTIGGAIKYVTKSLNFEEPELTARINVGTFGQFDQIVSGSMPISDTFAVGGAIANYKRNGFGTNLNTGAEHYDKDLTGYRISAEWRPTDSFNFRFSADRTEDDSNAKHGHRLIPSSNGQFPVTEDVFDTRAGLGDANEVMTQGVSLTAEWTVNDNLTLKSITAYREGETTTPIDFDALPQPDFDVPAFYNDDQFSQELQAIFEYGRVSGIAGFYYLDAFADGAFDLLLEQLAPGFAPLTVFQGGEQSKENISVFADVTVELTDKLDISLGARYTQDDTVADVTRETWLGLGSGSFDPSNTTSVFLSTDTGFEGLERSDEEFTPRVSISYQPIPTLNLYASYSEGFKAGGFDPRARADLDPLGLSQEGFGPETVESYEIGAKGTLFDGRFSYAVAGFIADYTDQQITVQQGADSDDDGINDTFVSSVFNAGASEYRGIEFEGAFEVTERFTLSGVLGYIDAEIEEILTANASGGFDNIADQFVTQNTPELQYRLAASYDMPLRDNLGFVNLNAAVSYRDDYFLFNVANPGVPAGANANFPAGAPALDPESYALFDVSVNWTSANDKWRVSAHGRNLFDEEYRVAAYNFLTPSQLGTESAYSAFYGDPRTATLTIEYRY